MTDEIAAQVNAIEIGDRWFSETPGGLGRVHYQLHQNLPNFGINVSSLVVGSPQIVRETEGRVRAFSSSDAPLFKRMLACRREFISLATEQSPKLVAVHFALYAAPILDALIRRPFVVHFHGPWAYESAAEGGRSSPSLSLLAKKWIEQAVYRRANKIIVLSNYFGRILHDEYRIRNDRIRIIPGGVEAGRFDPKLSMSEARNQLGWDTKRPTVLVVRRLARRMGLENLIHAVRRLTSGLPHVLLKIVGRGAHKDTLQKLIFDLGLEYNIEMVGFISDSELPILYRAADISIVPSLTLEGFGLTTLESLAAGTPVLVTPVGGLSEAVQGLSSALVLQGTDDISIAEGLKAALSGGLNLPTSDQCKAFAQKHDWKIIAGKTADVYREAISQFQAKK